MVPTSRYLVQGHISVLQVKWSGLVFGSNCALATLLETQADMLASLEPSLSECIDAALKQTSEPLDFMTELKGVTQQFARSLDNALTAASQGRQERVEQRYHRYSLL
jgi:conserved oligomeric Golgi complex subunit 7